MISEISNIVVGALAPALKDGHLAWSWTAASRASW